MSLDPEAQGRGRGGGDVAVVRAMMTPLISLQAPPFELHGWMELAGRLQWHRCNSTAEAPALKHAVAQCGA